MNSMLKLFANTRFATKLHRVGKIFPVHVTICLNNADRSEELSLKDIKYLGRQLFQLKCQAVTLAGGDPLQHPYINEIIASLNTNTVKIGIVTEGTHLHHLMNHVPVYWIKITGKLGRKYLAEQKHRPICGQWLRYKAPTGDSTAGVKHCWVSLLKPVIRHDGGVCPCPERCDVSMGDDLFKIYTKQKPFNGSKCERCYSSDYNEFLNAFVKKPERMEWI